MNHNAIEITRLRHVYSDGTIALRDISLKVSHGESVAIIGANGAGKSTLLLHLNGCLAPTSGEIKINNHPISKTNLAGIRQMVGMVFQNPDDQLFMPTVFEDVAFGPLNLGLSCAEAGQLVKTALEKVGAVHLQDKPPYLLSGGEKKRVAIATVLSMSPGILVMDEPASGLDPFARRQLIKLLRDLKQTRIFTGHDLDMALELCERTIVLYEGEVRADGPTREVFNNNALLLECRLEKPLSMQSCPICGSAK